MSQLSESSPSSTIASPKDSAMKMITPYNPPSVRSSAAVERDGFIFADYDYRTARVEVCTESNTVTATPMSQKLTFKTVSKVPKTGLMIVGLGGNNGTTLFAGMLANKRSLTWMTKTGEQKSNWYGSVAMSGATRLGVNNTTHKDVFVPVRSLVPMLHPDDLEVSGWDISGTKLGDAMTRAEVLDYNLQVQLKEEMNEITPLPSIFNPKFIAANQNTRADNVIEGSAQIQVDTIREHIRSFKKEKSLDKVIVLWSANTERFCDHTTGVHDTADNLLKAVANNHEELAPSCLYAVAAISEGCSYINGSPQNTFCRGLVDLAREHRVYLLGDDLKTGQTKLKSVLVDYLVSAGLKPISICSYNHLGNNDGLNLSAPDQFKSKEISKSGVADDMLIGNPLLYAQGEKPDHIIVIKYVPAVGDSKRAVDEYTSKIFMNGLNTIAIHNTCEDSLLAAPIILDMVLFCEMCERITITVDNKEEMMEPLLSLLSYWCKAPAVPENAPVVNALFAQREAVVNFMRACIGLPPESFIQLEHRIPGVSLSKSV